MYVLDVYVCALFESLMCMCALYSSPHELGGDSESDLVTRILVTRILVTRILVTRTLVTGTPATPVPLTRNYFESEETGGGRIKLGRAAPSLIKI